MHLPRVCFPAVCVLLGAALPAAAQSVVSTRAGLVHYFEGDVSIEGTPLQPQFGRFPEIPEGAELRTAQGRAEVLLGPGVILRVAEDSAVKMVSSSLADTRLEVLSGTAMLESKDALPGNSVVLLYKDWQMRIPRQAAYRIDSEPEQLRVYDGEVEVRCAQGEPVTVKAGQTLPLATVLVPDQTLGPPGDGFNNWAFERSEAIAADNATAAQIVDDPALYPNLTDGSGTGPGGLYLLPAHDRLSVHGLRHVRRLESLWGLSRLRLRTRCGVPLPSALSGPAAVSRPTRQDQAACVSPPSLHRWLPARRRLWPCPPGHSHSFGSGSRRASRGPRRPSLRSARLSRSAQRPGA